MRLLLLGSAGPYPERLSAFLEKGHQLWLVCTEWLPKDDPRYAGITTCTFSELGSTLTEATERLVELMERERIEGVYSLLNVWDGSNRVTAALLDYGCPVPLIRHYKEHYCFPFEDERKCLERSTGVIFINEASRVHFAKQYRLPEQTACIDADLIPCRYLTNQFQPRLSAQDNRPHLLIAGSASQDGGRYDYRELIDELSKAGVHLHLYLQFRTLTGTGQLNNTAETEMVYRQLGQPGFVHFHGTIPPHRFVEEWSRYDAGLLHIPREDDPFRALNLPNRYSAYMAAGLPVALQRGAMPAMQQQLEQLGAGIFYNNPTDLLQQLPQPAVAARVKAVRERVTFEANFPELEAFIANCLYA